MYRSELQARCSSCGCGLKSRSRITCLISRLELGRNEGSSDRSSSQITLRRAKTKDSNYHLLCPSIMVKKKPSFLTDPNFDFSDMYVDVDSNTVAKDSPKKNSRKDAAKSTKSVEPDLTTAENSQTEQQLRDRVHDLEQELIKYQLENCSLAGFKRGTSLFLYLFKTCLLTLSIRTDRPSSSSCALRYTRRCPSGLCSRITIRSSARSDIKDQNESIKASAKQREIERICTIDSPCRGK